MLIVWRFNIFTIKDIEVKAEKVNCADTGQIKNASGLLGQNFFLIDSLKTEDDLKKKFICIKSAAISKMLPDKVQLKVSNREALAILAQLKKEASFSATPSAGDIKEQYLIDDEGFVFGKGDFNSNIVQIFVNDLNISLGQKLTNQIPDVIKILQKVKTLQLNFNRGWIDDSAFVIYSDSPVLKVTFSLKSNIEVQLASLQLILDKAKIDLKELEFIDLRFDKPIVKFAPKK